MSAWKQGQQIEVPITDLAEGGNGVGRYGDHVVFVPDTVPGDRASVRLVRVKSKYAEGKLLELLEASSSRVRPACIVADKCGGCQWQQIEYDRQLAAKRQLVLSALERVGGFSDPPVGEVLPSPSPFGYRNKVTYPLRLSPTGQVRAGYYQKGSHRLINLNQCPVQDERLNPLLANIKQDIQNRGWLVYDERQHRGTVRHLSFRIGRRTGEMLLTLIAADENLPGLAEQAQMWMEEYPQLVGVCVNVNRDRTNAIFGQKTRGVAGKPYLKELFGGLQFRLGPDTFFQVNTEAAETLLSAISEELDLQGDETLVDAYCGIGTFTLPLAKQLRSQTGENDIRAIGLEFQQTAVEQARFNADLNDINHVSFRAGTVQKLLPKLELKPDVVLLDPPRKGCDRATVETLRSIRPQRIVYISCRPVTFSRDLKLLCEGGIYRITRVQPADFFPQTSHVECAAFLSLCEDQ
ncbi:23S rRNA (uracil(1939)-C(5))-methyltransferase RlmD [Lyngbya sp. CCY1209]|uniref:23S rRNA (uracil(1939)-C(5))-methyltransferase RlmD n=1 Tax=Lyngbya sp. CCY1209 TaxID=2886103 RepID=UPI002D207B29|nr:23S rRNA (uracil(1939)-C(5))-methyltransferase RlmD [Lyngbya sp. CCY1209]MEB3886110.1 23S rRNA (uracil(1939)-C(5))-methyltransferase RlmD [Lyngbya sp. CCY1209]